MRGKTLVRLIVGLLIVVVVLYFATVAVILVLSQVDPITGALQGTLEEGGGSLWFAAGGILAAFVLLAALGPVFIYLVIKLLSQVSKGAASVVRDVTGVAGKFMTVL